MGSNKHDIKWALDIIHKKEKYMPSLKNVRDRILQVIMSNIDVGNYDNALKLGYLFDLLFIEIEDEDDD